jgi:tetratricopeptide (TPR) repeat protein
MNKRYILPILLGILILTCILSYSPVVKNDFLNWDDDVYVVNNNDIKAISTENVKHWFTKKYVEDYLPVTIFSFAIDYQIDGLNAKTFIITNLIIHIINAVLVFFLILLLLKYINYKSRNRTNNLADQNYFIAFFTSILFATHPINAESVAWISERKNLLYAMFYILSIISYIKYVHINKNWLYIVSILFFILSLLSKGLAVTLPLSLIALDILYQRKIFTLKVIIEKIPFLLLSVILGIITYHSQNNGVIKFNSPFTDRFAYASLAFFEYLYKLIFPINLSAFYPFPTSISFTYWIYFIILLASLFVFIKNINKIPSIITFAILFFIINIIFLIQLIPFGIAIIADRYIYISSIGFFLLISIFFVQYLNKKIFYGILILFILFCSYSTFERTKVWNNSLAFWNEVIKNNSKEFIPQAWNNRGTAKEKLGDLIGALEDLNKAIELKPDDADFYFNRGELEMLTGNLSASLIDLNVAIKINPNKIDAYYEKGEIMQLQGNYNEALNYYNYVLNNSPIYKEAYIKVGEIYEIQNDFNNALINYQKAVSIDPLYKDAYYSLGNIYMKSKKFDLAVHNLNIAINIMPQFKEAYNLKGIIDYFMNNKLNALNDFSIAIKVDSAYSDAYFNRAKLYKLLNNIDSSMVDVNKAIEYNPKFLNAYIMRARLRLKQNDFQKAIDDCNEAIKINDKLLITLTLKAYALEKLGKINDAIQLYNEAIAIAPDSGMYYYNKGILEFKINNMVASKFDLQKAHEKGFIKK